MPLELHVLGAAFGLPSIDAECLATIAYLRQCLPSGEWVVVASSDPSISPTNELPALKCGGTWVSRFRNIVDYLRQYSAGEWDLDNSLGKLQKADCIAFSSFIESRGQPLLDLSLYVSSENYTSCTRSALADILSWPNHWTLPPKLRRTAKRRSEHLGLSSLDIDSALDEQAEDMKFTAQIPKSLRNPKETVSSLLGKSTQRSRFRLDAVTAEFMEPLNELLGEEDFFLSDATSSLDCLALGYLALMQSPELPQEWLRRSLKDKFPSLGAWTRRSVRECFGAPTKVSDTLTPSLSGGGKEIERKLPWQAPIQPTLPVMIAAVWENSLDSLPVVGQLRTNGQLKKFSQNPDLEDYESKAMANLAANRNRELYSQIVVVGGGFGIFIGYLMWVGVLKLPRGQSQGNGRRNFGTAGAMLGLG